VENIAEETVKEKLRYFWMERVAGGSLDYRGADD